MLFATFLNITLSIILSYSWLKVSQIYVEISRSYASSSYPGDITDSQRYTYLIFFPITLLFFLLIFTFILRFIFRKKISFSLLKIIVLFIAPVLCSVVVFIELYHHLF